MNFDFYFPLAFAIGNCDLKFYVIIPIFLLYHIFILDDKMHPSLTLHPGL